jgi:hypothetical protein
VFGTVFLAAGGWSLLKRRPSRTAFPAATQQG